MDGIIACLDVHYREGGCAAACVSLERWDAARGEELAMRLPPAAPYLPGRFFERELPALLAILERLGRKPACAVVDGYVWLSADGRAGLGAHLFEALRREVAVVGVAKKPFAGAEHALEVFRGTSARPLLITAAGIDAQTAARHVRQMAGAHRIPEPLARADRLARQALALR